MSDHDYYSLIRTQDGFLDPSQFPFAPIPPASAPGSTVKVSIIPAGTIDAPFAFFADPVPNDRERVNSPAFSFLIENKERGEKVLFDLGIAKDVMTTGTTPAMKGFIAVAPPTVEKDVVEHLDSAGVDPSSIDAIILSHVHFDHIGNPETFPTNVDLVLGPGTRDHHSGFPEDPRGRVFGRWLEPENGRKVCEIDFDEKPQMIGGYKAYDYWGDGSLYLLECPGHCHGHVLALARTTPDTFVLAAGDTCHHGSLLRPSTLPPPSADFLLPEESSLYQSLTRPKVAQFPHPDPSKPAGSKRSMHENIQEAEVSIAKLERFDALPNVWVVLAHDEDVERVLSREGKLWPEQVTDWYDAGWKKMSWRRSLGMKW